MIVILVIVLCRTCEIPPRVGSSEVCRAFNAARFLELVDFIDQLAVFLEEGLLLFDELGIFLGDLLDGFCDQFLMRLGLLCWIEVPH